MSGQFCTAPQNQPRRKCLPRKGVLSVFNTETAKVVRYDMATGAALGGPDDFIVPGTSGLASPRYMAFAPPADADADGLPDAWEHTHGLSSANPLDAAQDADGDGQTNLAEYQSGTDPRDPASTPGATDLRRDAQGLLLTFRTIRGRFYPLEAKTDLANPADPWLTIVIRGETRGKHFRDAGLDLQQSSLGIEATVSSTSSAILAGKMPVFLVHSSRFSTNLHPRRDNWNGGIGQVECDTDVRACESPGASRKRTEKKGLQSVRPPLPSRPISYGKN